MQNLLKETLPIVAQKWKSLDSDVIEQLNYYINFQSDYIQFGGL